jgi:hypothetical protein
VIVAATVLVVGGGGDSARRGDSWECKVIFSALVAEYVRIRLLICAGVGRLSLRWSWVACMMYGGGGCDVAQGLGRLTSCRHPQGQNVIALAAENDREAFHGP